MWNQWETTKFAVKHFSEVSFYKPRKEKYWVMCVIYHHGLHTNAYIYTHMSYLNVYCNFILSRLSSSNNLLITWRKKQLHPWTSIFHDLSRVNVPCFFSHPFCPDAESGLRCCDSGQPGRVWTAALLAYTCRWQTPGSFYQVTPLHAAVAYQLMDSFSSSYFN